MAQVNGSSNNTVGTESDIHVITENGEQCFMWRSNQLTYIAQDRQELPQILATKFGHLATKLDLSYNTLTSFRNINQFTTLSELILDNNSFVDEQLDFRQNLRLKTLSLNKNKLTDLHRLVNSIKIHFPNLEYLSLIGNPLCPEPIVPVELAESQLSTPSESLTRVSKASDSSLKFIYNQRTEYDNQKYRYFIIYHLPNLRFLDSSPISGQERDSALRCCQWMRPFQNSHAVPELTSVGQGNNSNGNGGTVPAPAYVVAPEGFQMTIMSDYNSNGDSLPNAGELNSESPDEWPAEPQVRGAFARLAYKYTGRNSEGNRFIRNQDL